MTDNIKESVIASWDSAMTKFYECKFTNFVQRLKDESMPLVINRDILNSHGFVDTATMKKIATSLGVQFRVEV